MSGSCSHSTFFPLVRVTSTGVSVLSAMVTAEGKQVLLTGVAQTGSRASLLLARANTLAGRLVGLGRGPWATQESGQYVPLRNAYQERSRTNSASVVSSQQRF